MTPLAPDQLLKQRGLLDVATAQGWTPLEAAGTLGWAYPVYNAKAVAYKERRWKSCNGSNPRYRWIWSKPDNAKYYFVPGAFAEIINTSGNCWLAGGEPDVLAFYAAGIKNAICWLDGEGSPPDTLADDLSHMGVTVLLYAPDRDHQGMVAAHKVRELLDGTGIILLLFELPGDLDSKFDIGDLWIASNFKPKMFKDTLDGLPALDAIDAFLHAKQKSGGTPATVRVESSLKTWRNDWSKLVIAALGSPAVIEAGNERWHCPFPGHEDKSPSFRISTDKNPSFPWPMCSCGIHEHKDAWDQLAAVLNVDSWDDYKALQAANEGYTRAPCGTNDLSRAPEGSAQIPDTPKWIEMGDMFTNLQNELKRRYTPEIYPFVAPLKSLHKFGGFARFSRRGKLTCISGVSGGAKTLLLKTMMITLLKDGHDVIWWGPEWSPYEYAEQHLQRAGGLTMDQLDEWRLWEYYEKQGNVKEMSAKYGLTKPSQAAIDNSIEKLDEIRDWPGKMYIVDPRFSMTHKQVLETAFELTMLKTEEGRDMTAFVLDYTQLAQKKGKQDWTWAESVVNDVKVMCGQALLHGYISTQVRKGDSEKVRKGEKLKEGAAQGLSDQQFNLYLTFTPDVDEAGNFGEVGTMAVVKNSRGRKGSIRNYIDFQHLTVVDREVTGVDLGDFSPAYADNGGKP